MPDLTEFARIAVPVLKSAQFAVVIDGEASPLRAGFSQVSGLGASVQTYTTEESGDRLQRQYPIRGVNKPVTLIKGVDVDAFLMKWHEAVRNWEPGRPNYRRNVSIYLLQRVSDHVAVARRGWDLFGAYPIEWSGPNVNAQENALAFESVVLNYDLLQSAPLISAAVINL